MAEKKSNRSKHISYPAQREQCRLNKHTYIEKCNVCGQKHLMCNYPFPKPEHKKGFCKASTCTDMRTIPEEILEADKEEDFTNDAGKKIAEENSGDAAKDLSGKIDEEVMNNATEEKQTV